ncbi:hypothetical protein [Luteimicrobium subarcticum]|uniref:Uncharacterized protein n=1 Tax=Luteimicrobium subarcticum TaxID=620910 RepID=A0A2M8WVN3_9MICO|nr:hypothetical protein [Luteimicrobium subarcticum]PJI94978.1 hypothetical protein CLV34_0830 [Luteimicrobium subarcticum]
MRTRVVDFSLDLPEDWCLLPASVDDGPAWCRAAASQLVAADVAAGDAPPDPAAITSLADAIGAVLAAVEGAGLPALRGAALVRRPGLGRVDAMLTVVLQRDVVPETYVGEIEQAVRSGGGYLSAQRIDATVLAGRAAGMHLVIGHLEPEAGPGVAHLEERVALGVAPVGCGDMLELTLVAAAASTFDDVSQVAVDLLAGLTVRTEAA